MCDGHTESFSSRDICRGAYEDVRKLCFSGPSPDDASEKNPSVKNHEYQPQLFDPYPNYETSDVRSDQNTNRVEIIFPSEQSTSAEKEKSFAVSTVPNLTAIWFSSSVLSLCRHFLRL